MICRGGKRSKKKCRCHFSFGVLSSAGQQVQSLQLRERLAELEIEIERFKKENIALSKLRQENEKMQENLR